MIFRKEDKGVRFELFLVAFFQITLFGFICFFIFIKVLYAGIVFLGLIPWIWWASRFYYKKLVDTINIRFEPALIYLMSGMSTVGIILLKDYSILDNFIFYISWSIYIFYIPIFYILFRNKLLLKG